MTVTPAGAGEDAPDTTHEATISSPSTAPEIDAQYASLDEPGQSHGGDRTRVFQEDQDALKQELQKHKQKFRDLKQAHLELKRDHQHLKRDHQELSQEVFELQEDLLELKARFDSVVRS